MMLTRREWSKMALTGIAGMMVPRSFAQQKASDVIIGLQTYSLRDRSLDEAIQAMIRLNIKSCELWEGHVEPRELQWKRNSSAEETRRKKEEMTAWRNALQMEEIHGIREKFRTASIKIQAYTATFKDSISEHDLELAFRIAQALGTDTITTSAQVSVMKRVDVLAGKYNIQVGMHNHAHVDQPNEFSTPDSFKRGMEGLSEHIKINLDIGHFTAADFDAVAFLRDHHRQIVCLHIKDRKQHQGVNMPFGEGDTPIAAVLRLVRDNNWPIPANIEYEYNRADTETELKKCIAYCHDILKS